MERSKTRYAWNGDDCLAYQVVGEGPVDLVYLQGQLSNVVLNWEHPAFALTEELLKEREAALTAASGETQAARERIEALIKSEKKLYPNVDFYSASTYYTMGIAIDLYTPIFAVSRISGWTAHVLEQLANNRLIRPRADYTGPTYPQTWLPLDQR